MSQFKITTNTLGDGILEAGGVERMRINASGSVNITGQIKITGGSPGNNKILTSDNNGLATWTAPAVGGTIAVTDTTDTTCFIGLWESATGEIAPKTDLEITYNAGTSTLTVPNLIVPNLTTTYVNLGNNIRLQSTTDNSGSLALFGAGTKYLTVSQKHLEDSGESYASSAIRFTSYNSDGLYFFKDGSSYTYTLTVDNHIRIFNGTTWKKVLVSGSVSWSDDRIKYNEQPLVDGLHVIRQLTPLIYNKRESIMTAEQLTFVAANPDTVLPPETKPHPHIDNVQVPIHSEKEVGLIAQDVATIPQLAHTVEQDGGGIYSVCYNDVFTYNIAATKELDAIVQTQQTTINQLLARITILENLVNG